MLRNLPCATNPESFKRVPSSVNSISGGFEWTRGTCGCNILEKTTKKKNPRKHNYYFNGPKKNTHTHTLHTHNFNKIYKGLYVPKE